MVLLLLYYIINAIYRNSNKYAGSISSYKLLGSALFWNLFLGKIR